ncbi:MAG: hypothetical protein JRJ44_09090 [Deltaproteobacteria bacterium]|nr:hypothetical protein [Deltaproteobacteria bacterium]
MKKQNNADDYDLKPEYDLSSMPVTHRGRYLPEKKTGKNASTPLIIFFSNPIYPLK